MEDKMIEKIKDGVEKRMNNDEPFTFLEVFTIDTMKMNAQEFYAVEREELKFMRGDFYLKNLKVDTDHILPDWYNYKWRTHSFDFLLANLFQLEQKVCGNKIYFNDEDTSKLLIRNIQKFQHISKNKKLNIDISYDIIDDVDAINRVNYIVKGGGGKMVYKEERWNKSHVHPFINHATYLFMKPFIVYYLKNIDIISDCICYLYFKRFDALPDEEYKYIYDTEYDPYVISSAKDGQTISLAQITRVDLSNTLFPLVDIERRREENEEKEKTGDTNRNGAEK